jgi:hypothetical protein
MVSFPSPPWIVSVVESDEIWSSPDPPSMLSDRSSGEALTLSLSLPSPSVIVTSGFGRVKPQSTLVGDVCVQSPAAVIPAVSVMSAV